MNRQALLLFALITISTKLFSQDFGGETVGLGNYIKRMYNAAPFNGVKLLESENGKNYLISVVELKNDPSKPESVQSRIASVKAKSYASQYLNGSNISTDIIIINTEEKLKDSVVTKTTMQEILKENSAGFVNEMELLTKFQTTDVSKIVYIYVRELKLDRNRK